MSGEAVAGRFTAKALKTTFESFLDWIDHHPNPAVWIQAIGVTGSLWVALIYYRRKEVHRREDDQKRAKHVITQLKPELGKLRLKLNEVETAPFKKKKISLPKMMQRSRHYLLGDVGTDLDLLADQLISLNGLQAEAEIKEAQSSCRQQLDSISEKMKEMEAGWSDKKPFVVRRVIDATQRFFGASPSV
jgi:hypothetical protein